MSNLIRYGTLAPECVRISPDGDLVRYEEYQALRDENARLREDAARYRRLRVFGCAPSTSKNIEAGTVLCFTNLDQFIDDDIKAYPSRGEALLTLPEQEEGGK